QENQSEANMTFEDMINDAAGFVTMLKEDSRFSEVIVLGHSEGSLIGMVAANKGKANKYISVAGIAERADKVIEKQLSKQSKEMKEKATVLMDSIVNGYTVKTIDPMLSGIFRPSVMPYMSSWLKYDPCVEIKKLTTKVLIIQGTTDLQVDTDEAEMLKKAYPAATLKIIDGMNHVLKNAPRDLKQNMATYAATDLPLNAVIVPSITKFINEK
ncbi:MAG: hypothetical protein JWQ38_657, partial [Flavipsychrobacter sp.]|nr:hypothetical protein [Flavipsychrobacter sp.]